MSSFRRRSSAASQHQQQEAGGDGDVKGDKKRSNAKSGSVSVSVRIRPLNTREIKLQHGDQSPAWIWGEDTIAERAGSAQFTYDHLFHPLATTEMVYKESVKELILAAMQGYHGSVLAYGQTSTGKTHTMHGVANGDIGIISLAVKDCFDYIQSSEEQREFLLRVSYLEIYNEQLNDLLCPANTNVRLVADLRETIAVRGAKEEVVISPAQVIALVAAGEAQRHVGSTEANRASSRSHSIFRLVIESRPPPGLKGRPRVSTLSLVDLAGSESAKLSGTSSGDRKLEASFINKSLLVLGQIIYKLSEGAANTSNVHLPYRDSKLTRLLQPSLGGNAHVSLICTLSPSVPSLEESKNTLKFASRAKRMQNRARLNENDTDEGTLIAQYREEICQLKDQLARAEAARSEEHDTEEQLQNAISHLERLILKSRCYVSEIQDAGSFSTPRRDTMMRRHGRSLSAEVPSIINIFADSPQSLSSGDQEAPTPSLSPTGSSRKKTELQLNTELERLHGELNRFLERKRRQRQLGPNTDSFSFTPPKEMEHLKAELHALEVGSTLSRADSRFLQGQLSSKQQDLTDCVQLLDEMEQSQERLLKENADLKSEVEHLNTVLEAREAELLHLKGLSSARDETF
jgi:hypothetical protein